MAKVRCAGLVSIAIVVGMLLPTTVAITAQAAIGTSTDPGVQTPRPLVSDTPDPATPTVRTGDFSNEPPTASQVGQTFPALKQGEGFDPERSVLDESKTTATSEVYANPDGTETANISTGPVRFKGPDSVWHHYDLRLQPADKVANDSPLVAASRAGITASPGDFVAHASDVAASLSSQPSKELGRVATSAGQFVVGVPDVAGELSAPSLDAAAPSTASYQSGQSGVLVKMSLKTGGVEQSLVVGSAKGPSQYTVPVTMPAGVAAKAFEAGVEFVDASGKVIAIFGGGTASDAGKAQASTPVTSTLLDQGDGLATIRVSVDAKWFADADRVFPITIDPWINTVIGAQDTYLNSANAITNYSSNNLILVGRFGPAEVDRGLMKYTGLPSGSDLAVLSGQVRMYATGGGMTTAAKQLNVDPVTQTVPAWYIPPSPPDYPSGVNWYNQPAADGLLPVTSATVPAGTTAGPVGLDVTALVSQQLTKQIPNWGVGVLVTAHDENTDGNNGKIFFSTEGANAFGADWDPHLTVTWKHLPNQVTLASPVNDATVSTVTPTLTAHLPSPASPDGDTVAYWYKLSTGPDGNSGAIVVASGWLPWTPGTDGSWTVPKGYLQNGGTYYWNVTVGDPWVQNVPNMTWKLNVDLRLGASGPSPFDQVGSIGVNLATGNVNYTQKSQSFPTVGGDLGLTYSYNSSAPVPTGLQGEYYSNTSGSGSPVTTQEDQTMRFDWHGAAPVAGTLGINWYARWTGYLTLPDPTTLGGTGNNWIPVVSSHAGARVWINNVLVYDSWLVQGNWDYGHIHNGTQFTQAPNTPVAIKIEYFDNDNTQMGAPMNGALDVRIRPASRNYDPNRDLPLGGDWLSPAAPPLPSGWTASADLNGTVPYTQLINSSNTAALTAADGEISRYAWNGTGYTPSAGLDGVLTFTCSSSTCFWDYIGDGWNERFNADGTLAWAKTVSDDRHPAAITYSWTTPGLNSPARLTSITDPVSGRAALLHYSGDSQCLTDGAMPDGYHPAPAGMLCQVDFTQWGAYGGTNEFFYADGSNWLGEIRGLGNGGTNGYEVTTFSYNSSGLLTNVRSPEANDQYGSLATDSPNTVVAYDPELRAQRVSAPEPAPTGTPNPSSRQKHTYTYTPATRTATVTGKEPDGTEPTIATYHWDDAARQTSSTDATGHISTQDWSDAADAVKSSTDPAGQRTTTIFDAQHRPTDVYGPAPVAWFNGLVPAAGHEDGSLAPMAHSTTAYDGGMTGLAAAWYNSSDLTGNPALHTFFSGIYGNPNLSGSWGAGSPGTGVNVDNFSGQLTGEILLPNAGAGANRWQFKLVADDGGQVFVDDQLIVNNWEYFDPANGTTGTLPFDVSQNTWHRIRINFQEKTGSAYFNVYYRRGSTDPWTAIPKVNLTPRYDLVTHNANPDGHVVDTSYSDFNGIGPQHGLPTYTFADPSSLNLTSHTAYEDPAASDTYLRPVGHQTPNDISASVITSDTYYDPGESRTFPTMSGCPTGTVNQGQMAEKHTSVDPDPAASGAGHDPTTQEIIYNNQGLPAFTRQADNNWSCTAYDSRLRISKTIASDGKVTSYDYSNPGTVVVTAADSGGTSRTTTATVDLLGRMTSYTDEQGTVTRTVYDIAGRVRDLYRTLPGGSETHLSASTYDYDGRLLTNTEYVSGPSGRTTTTTYDSAGRPIVFDRPTDTYPIRTTTTYDGNTGRLNGLTTQRNGVTQWTDGYNYSLAGKVTVDWSTSALRQYVYDNVGRLTTSSENGAAVRKYAFDADSNRCNSSLTIVGCNTPAYSYNPADQLTSSPSGTSYVYDNRGRLDTYTKPGGGVVNIDYDANDHAKRIDDGTSRVDETLDPSGRVLRRVVTSPPGGATTEDTTFGYSGPGDSPAWSRPTSGGTYTTYLGTTIFSGTTPSYQIENSHGDVVGTTNQSGTFTAAPPTDEFGVSATTPTSRLGWLGSQERFTDHAGLGIIRMGARLYQPSLGRFLEEDSFEGGSCNDYDYVCGDPVNGLDLSGQYADGVSPAGWKYIHNHPTAYANTRFSFMVPCTGPCGHFTPGIDTPPNRTQIGHVPTGRCHVCRKTTGAGVTTISVGGVAFVNVMFSSGHWGVSAGCCAYGASVSQGFSSKSPCQRDSFNVGAGGTYGVGGYGNVGVKNGKIDGSDAEAGGSIGGKLGASVGPSYSHFFGC